jgi:uncharacterized membrane protein YcaP (DUF421 family)
MLASTLVFIIIFALLRVVGLQAVGKMSGFDLVFAVTFGDVIGTVAITTDTRRLP